MKNTHQTRRQWYGSANSISCRFFCWTFILVTLLNGGESNRSKPQLTYPIVDTGQSQCYDDARPIPCPRPGSPFYGQDACYNGNQPRYRDHGDGTVTDLVTQLMWQQEPGDKMTLREALRRVSQCRLGGYKDWRIPTIKELYSLILFSGTEPHPQARSAQGLRPFIDTRYFHFHYGDPRKGERIIDAQYASITRYVSTTMHGNPTIFGVNFADGRIKGYPIRSPRGETRFYFLFVRGNPNYGRNRFRDNGDGTISDLATGLMWMKVDSGALKAGRFHDGRLDWREALEWAENLTYAGYSDWRLPNIKELQSIVDYTRSPATHGTAALAPMFRPTAIQDEGGRKNFPFYWSSTTHLRFNSASAAAYIAIGEALGFMLNRRSGKRELLDVHGAGAQRSDPKQGDPRRFPKGRGPQGDVVRIYNYTICVRQTGLVRQP